MKPIHYILIIFLALVLVLLDVSFFSMFSWEDSTIIISYAVAITFALGSNEKKLIIFTASLVLLFAFLSSIPIWADLLLFFFYPYLLFYLRTKYLPTPSILTSLSYFAVSAIIFQLTFVSPYLTGIKSQAALSLVTFVILNSWAGYIIFVLKSLGKEKIKRLI